MMENEKNGSRVAGFLTGVVALVLVLLSAYGFMRLFAPEPYQTPVPPFADYDSTPLRDALSPEALAERFALVEQSGLRFMGQPGTEAVYRQIRDAYQKAGLEILELRDTSAAPVTLERRLTDTDGQPLGDADLEVFPFFPNTFQPMNTPAGGLRGRLVPASRALEREHENLRGAIVVADLSDPEVRVNWPLILSMEGLAVLVTHADGLEHVPWNRSDLSGVSAGNAPVNFVRAAVTPSILAHLGQEVLLDVRTAWKPVEHRTIMGLLRAPSAASEALVVSTSYDAFSLLPDWCSNPRTAVPVAAHLQIVEAIGHYADSLQRDVVFVAFGGQMSASAGERGVLQFIGPHAERREVRSVWQQEFNDNRQRLVQLERITSLFDQEGFFTDAEHTADAVASLSSDDRGFLREQVRFAVNTLAVEKEHEVIRWKSVFEREGGSDLTSKAFQRYMDANLTFNAVQARASHPLADMLRASEGVEAFMHRHEIDRLVRERFAALLAHHRLQAEKLETGLQVSRMFGDYRQIVALDARLLPLSEPQASETLTFLNHTQDQRDDAVFADVMRSALLRLPAEARPSLSLRIGRPGAHDQHVRGQLGDAFADRRGADLWNTFGYAGFTLATANNREQYDLYFVPYPVLPLGAFETISRNLDATAETLLSLAHGNGRFALPRKMDISRIDFTGTVYLAGIGRSIVPNFPAEGAIVGQYNTDSYFRGRMDTPLVFTDLYGGYALRFTPVPFTIWGNYAPTAVRYGADGLIQFVKDVGPTAQRIYDSENINFYTRGRGGRDIHLVLFRAAPVVIPDMINPQTLRTFTSAQALRRLGLQPFASQNRIFSTSDGIMTLFVPPTELFYITFIAGDMDNESVQTVRAFALGYDPAYPGDPDLEIDGPGFLAEYTPVLYGMPFHTTHSMASLNAQRLRLQTRFGMADELTLEFHDRSLSRLEQLNEQGQVFRDRLQLAREALTYAVLNHPVIRSNVQEAVIGIIWYLGLLVPFIVFFEKLVFGYSDIRKQLVVHLLTFVIVFSLLRVLHPAFQMLRSSLMILLGFLIFLITTVITLLLSGKFKENLEAIRSKQAMVKGADVNTTGVLATAFLLGLNNMHRRKVRTGLTCATLVLLTFVMICFTSVQSNVVSTATAIGRAPYQGILVKGEDFAPLAAAEVAALRAKYGHRFLVNARSAYFGIRTQAQETFNPEIPVQTVVSEEAPMPRSYRFRSALLFEHTEPLAESLTLLTDRGWFTRDQQRDATTDIPVMLPDTAASELGIFPEAVNAGDVHILVGGVRCEVVGIFSARALDELRDADNRGILPFDVLALQTLRLEGANILADESAPRIPAGDIIIGLQDRFTRIPVMAGITRVGPRLVSASIYMPMTPYETVNRDRVEGVTYREAREAIEGYLEQSGRATYYGLDRFAYFGRRARTRSMAGLIDMLIPLVIAALTVVNTMRGSVYERRDEIFVYNAVGIAPRYIFFMFFAEAFVYSVVGSVLGYVLSQGTGRVLTVLGWTGGLNMNFTSLATVYASLTIAAAVFLSTWFPARSAMEIAAPAEDAGWKLPEPEGDRMHFKLPFTFDRHDRLAVLGFFARYLDDHGEGSSGPFFSGPPAVLISEHPDESGDGGAVPMVRATIWLKPFDLGVSHQLDIELPTDPETGEYIAEVTLTRLSGSHESWERLCKGFTARIRRHFLHWRAAGADMKKDLYDEVVATLRSTEATHG